jgi:glucose/mannose-6-phosphate isomerase
LIGVGPAGSPVREVVVHGGGVHVAVDQLDLPTRACLWAYVAPILQLAAGLGLAAIAAGDLAATADALDALAEANGVTVPPEGNAAKTLAWALAESLPVLWGDSPLAAIAAHRASYQLGRNARIPAPWGALPDAARSQGGLFTGPYAATGADDLFRDPFEDGAAGPKVQLVLVRDHDDARPEPGAFEHLRPLLVDAVAGPPTVRLASLIGLLDWASVYTALALGVDPSGGGPR